MRTLSPIALAIGLCSLFACAPTGLPFDSATAVRNPCGGWSELDGEIGAACGTCMRGRLTCDGRDALTCLGDAANACGTCEELPFEPGRSCGRCDGEWTCRDGELVCVDGEVNACGGCGELPGEPGAECGECGALWTCGLSGRLVCPDTSNECGGCSKLAGAPGAGCGECGAGTFVCEGSEVIRCDGPEGPAANACGGCAELESDPGKPCGRCGIWECTGSDHVECVEGGVLACGYPDADGDGFGVGESACDCDGGPLALRAGDCDDTDPDAHPVCGDGVEQCGDESGCTFRPELDRAATVTPLVGAERLASLRAPVIVDADLTGDGRADLAIAMPERLCSDRADRDCGAVAVLEGPISGFKLSYRALLAPSDRATSFGKCLAAGDLDGDGVDDLAVVGSDRDGIAVHVFLGPMAPTSSLQPETADFLLRPIAGTVDELASCHVAGSDADGRAVLLSFEDGERVDGLWLEPAETDDIAFAGAAGRRIVTDVVRHADGDRVFVVNHVDGGGVLGEVHTAVRAFRPTTVNATVTLVEHGSDPTARFQAAALDGGEWDDAIGSTDADGVSLWADVLGAGEHADGPLARVVGLGLEDGDGWPAAAGADLDGDGVVEIAIGDPSAISGSGGVVWGPLPDTADGEPPRFQPDRFALIAGTETGSALGTWMAMRSDLDGDGRRDLVVLAPGVEDSPTLAIFFARGGE